VSRSLWKPAFSNRAIADLTAWNGVGEALIKLKSALAAALDVAMVAIPVEEIKSKIGMSWRHAGRMWAPRLERFNLLGPFTPRRQSCHFFLLVLHNSASFLIALS
jgi:hypothetical protein